MAGKPHAAITLTVLFLFLLPEFSSASSLESVVTSLSVAGYTQFAAAVKSHVSEFETRTAALTYFAPSDNALNGINITPDFVRYHVASGSRALTYRDLVGFIPGALLQTLFDTAKLLVTESMGDQQKFSINNILVDVPNIYFNGNSSIHGVTAPLARAEWNSTSTCQATGATCNPPSRHTHARQRSGHARMGARASSATGPPPQRRWCRVGQSCDSAGNR